MGPFPILSFDKMKIVLSVLEDKSKFVFGIPVTSKQQASPILIQLMKRSSNSFSLDVKCLQADGGLKFKKVKDYASVDGLLY